MKVLNAGRLDIVGRHNTEHSLAYFARICTGTQDRDRTTEDDERLIRSLYQRGHLSVFEHAVVTMFVTMPIFVARQWVRHRIGWSWTEKSLRYCNASDLPFWIPMFADTKERRGYIDAYSEALSAYNGARELGISKQEARALLPVGIYTDVIMTTNLRAIDHFLKLRLDVHAQPQIRSYAGALLMELDREYPLWAKIFREENRYLIKEAYESELYVSAETDFE